MSDAALICPSCNRVLTKKGTYTGQLCRHCGKSLYNPSFYGASPVPVDQAIDAELSRLQRENEELHRTLDRQFQLSDLATQESEERAEYIGVQNEAIRGAGEELERLRAEVSALRSALEEIVAIFSSSDVDTIALDKMRDTAVRALGDKEDK